MNIEIIDTPHTLDGNGYKYTYRKAEYGVFLSSDQNSPKGFSISVWRTIGQHIGCSTYFFRNGQWKTNEGRVAPKYIVNDVVPFIEAQQK